MAPLWRKHLNSFCFTKQLQQFTKLLTTVVLYSEAQGMLPCHCWDMTASCCAGFYFVVSIQKQRNRSQPIPGEPWIVEQTADKSSSKAVCFPGKRGILNDFFAQINHSDSHSFSSQSFLMYQVIFSPLRKVTCVWLKYICHCISQIIIVSR